MSTEFSNQPISSPEQYDMIHLESTNEICLHALSILQTDRLSCYLPVFSTDEKHTYVIDSRDCISISNLNFRDRIYVRRNIRNLVSDFLLNIVSSMDSAMAPQGILYAQDQLYFHRKKKQLACVYLPLHSTLQGHAVRLTEFEEASLDELLRIPLARKWIPSERLEVLYQFIRNDDEDGARYFLAHNIWKRDSTRTLHGKCLLLIWASFLLFISMLYQFGNHLFRGAIMGKLIIFLVLASSICMIVAMLFSEWNHRKERKNHALEKSQRRKSRNAQILFPDDSTILNQESLYEFSDDPVQFTDVSVPPVHEREQSFTIWTKGFTVGLDSDCCDLSIDHSSVSLKHAFFGTDENGFYIEDLQSKQGSFVNRKRIDPYERYYLSDGDLVGIGKKEFLVHFIREKHEDHLPN